MRKQVKAEAPPQKTALAGTWLDLEALAQVEITSEDAQFPIENALTSGAGSTGWRAGKNGPQTILINFDTPQKIKRIVVRFTEHEHERMQEFSIHARTSPGTASSTAAGAKHELVRQQWSFSPGGSTEEVEDYAVDKADVTSIELTIDPDRGQNRYPATLAQLLIG